MPSAEKAINQYLGYYNIIQRRLIPDLLPQGALPRYETEHNLPSIVFDKGKAVVTHPFPTNQGQSIDVEVPTQTYIFKEFLTNDKTDNVKDNVFKLITKVQKTIIQFETKVFVSLLKKSLETNKNYIIIEKEKSIYDTKVKATKAINENLKNQFRKYDNESDYLLTGIVLNNNYDNDMFKELGDYPNEKVTNIHRTSRDYYYLDYVDMMPVEDVDYNLMIGISEPEFLGVTPIKTPIHIDDLTEDYISVTTDVGYGIIASDYVVGCRIQ